MNYGIEDVGVARKRVQFEIPADTVKAEVEKAYRNLGSNIKMKGFRQGKVPRKILEQRYGRSIQTEVASDLINKSWREVAPTLRVAGPPQIESKGSLQTNSPFTFTIGVDVRPDVTAVDYLDAEIDIPEIVVPDSMVDEAVQRRLQRAQRIVEVQEDRPVEQGDIVICQLVLKDGDQVVVREEGTAIHTNKERYYPGVDKLVLGLRKGEEKVESITIGEGSNVPGLAGRIFEAQVKPITIQATRVPDLNDDLAKELGFEGGVEGMRSNLRDQIRAQLDTQARADARNRLLWKIVDKNVFDVPESMVAERYDLMVEEAKALHTWSGKDPNAFNLTPKASEEYKRNARMQVRASLVLDAVARQESVDVEESDLMAAYQRIADERGQTVEAIKGYFMAENAVGLLRERLLEQKTLDWIFARAHLVVKPAPVETTEAPVAETPVEAPVAETPVETAEAPVAAAPVEAPVAETPVETAEAPVAAAPVEPEAPAAPAPKKRTRKKKEAEPVEG